MALGHSHKQETTNGGTDQGSEEAEYDDRQSMFPFTKEEQRVDALVHDGAAAKDAQNASDQRDLTKWTKALAIATTVLAFATFIVACVSIVGAIDTRRLAEAARDQADTAMDTERRQLRAHVGPIYAAFRLATDPDDCSKPSTATFSPDLPVPREIRQWFEPS